MDLTTIETLIEEIKALSAENALLKQQINNLICGGKVTTSNDKR